MEGSLPSRLAKILMAYQIIPQTTTGVSPAELLLGRQPHTRLDLLKPNIGGRVEGKQHQQKLYNDNSTWIRQFNIGDKVYVQKFRTWSEMAAWSDSGGDSSGVFLD